MFSDSLNRLAIRVADREYDPRHALLDVSRELQALEPEAAALPATLASEFREILSEIRAVQPVFPSRRETSSLFDRSGLGHPGRERAERLVRRLVSLSRAVAAATPSDQP
jgi:hypothetical protein